MIDWTTPTPEDVEKILEKWGPVISHFMQLFREKGNTYLDFLEGVWLWSQRSADGERDVAISATMVKDLSILRDAYLSQAQEEDRLRSGFQRTIDDLSRTIDVLQAENQALKEKGEQLCCRVGVLEMENQALREQVAELSGYLMRLVNENADHQLEIHKLKNTLAANHIQMNSRQDELVPRYRSLEFGWHRYWLTRTYFEQAAKDANEMARLVQANIRELFEHDGMVGWDELPEWKDAQTIIDRYKSDGRRVWMRKEGDR